MILAQPAGYEYFYEWKVGYFHTSEALSGAYYVNEGDTILSFDVPQGIDDPDFYMYGWTPEDSDAEVMRVSVPTPAWLDCIGVNRV